MSNVKDFGQGSIWKLIAQMAIPTIITMMVAVIYNMADTFFIGQTGNDLMVAAVSLAAPVFVLMVTVGNLIGVGGTTSISHALGAGNRSRAKLISAFVVYLSIFVALGFTAIIFIFPDPILHLLGTSEHTHQFTKEYVLWTTIGLVFIILSAVLSNIIRAEGAAKESMIGNLIGTVVNIVLDPIMILNMDMGVAGAAIATVIGNICAVAYYIWFFNNKKKKHLLSINWSHFAWHNRIAFKVFSLGAPSALGSFLMSFSIVFMNQHLLAHGDEAIAAMGVGMRIGMMVGMLQMGLCMGVLPILAFNYGANNIPRLKETVFKTGFIAVCLGSFLTAVCYFACEPIVRGFVTDPVVIDLGIRIVHSVILPGPFLGLFFLSIVLMQALGKALPPIIVSILRQGFVFIPTMMLLDHFYGLDGLIFTHPVSDYISILIGLVVSTILINHTKKSDIEHDADAVADPYEGIDDEETAPAK